MMLKRSTEQALHEIALPNGETADLQLRSSKRAKRLSLRLMPGATCFELVIPAGYSERKALSFAKSRCDWIAARVEKMQPVIPFAEGAIIPFRGQTYEIQYKADLLETVWIEGEAIIVTKRPSRLANGIETFLKDEARTRLTSLADEKAAMIDQTIGRVSLRDGKTRWGSCSARGNLSFSWRIIMAPDVVSDYLVAHEVAHLAELNHGARFWRIAEELSDDMAAGRDWLRDKGATLHRYGGG